MKNSLVRAAGSRSLDIWTLELDNIRFLCSCLFVWVSWFFYEIIEHGKQIAHAVVIALVVAEVFDGEVHQNMESGFAVVDEAVGCRLRIRCQVGRHELPCTLPKPVSKSYMKSRDTYGSLHSCFSVFRQFIHEDTVVPIDEDAARRLLRRHQYVACTDISMEDI